MNERFSLVDRQVPYLHEKQIEREARYLLDEYELKFERKVTAPIPLEKITEFQLQLTLEFKDMKSLFPFADVHGAIAILGTLGNMGIQGSDAGTSLRRLLTLSAAEAQSFQEEFGVATMDAAGNSRRLIDILGEVSEATSKLPTGERAAKFARVFGMLDG